MSDISLKDQSKYVVVIPARGGSQRLPGKNIKDLGGIPLIAHSIRYAQRNLPDSDIYVSTDNKLIADISIQYGAQVIERPAELSGELATTASAMQHAAVYLLENGKDFEHLFLLQPTNPLRPDNLIKEAISYLETGQYDSLFTVSPLLRKLGRVQEGTFIPWNYTFGQRSQDMETLYYENGLLYVVQRDLIAKEGILMGKKLYPLVVDHVFGTLDIDTLEDFTEVEYFYKKYN